MHPIALVREWLEQARAAGVPLADAACLATADGAGAPSARMVLLRGIEDDGLVFFTDRRSRKAADLAANPRGAIVLHWAEQRRQVRVEGAVELLADARSDAYFAQRPRGHRISAWASQQSAPVPSRAELERQWAEAEERFRGGDVPRPPHWGGYLLRPSAVELWEERADRLHERRLFTRDGTAWRLRRLQP